MLLAQEFATGQSGIGYTLLDWKRAVPTLACRWRDGIIKPVIVPYLQQHNVGIFQHDNARPHTARHTRNILGIQCVAVACTINGSLSHWARMGPLRSSGETAPWYQRLERALQAELVTIPLQVIRKLICSMRHRCMAVLAANGGHTRYWAVSEFLRLTPSLFH